MNIKKLNSLNQKGIGHHLLLLVVAVLAVVSAAGFFVWQRQKNSEIFASALTGCATRSFSTATNNRDACVRNVQGLLAFHGYNPGPIDSIFGTQTRTATINFQKSRYITADGIVGPSQTWPKLCQGASKSPYYTPAGCPSPGGGTPQPPGTPPSSPRPVSSPSVKTTTSGCVNTEYKLNGKSSCITHIQWFMNDLRGNGNKWIEVNGVYGTDLRDAIRDFQSARGIRADGAVGPAQTWPSLCKAARTAIEANMASSDVVNSYFAAGCNTKGLIISSSAVVCRAGSNLRLTQRSNSLKNLYFTNGINTKSSYISGYQGKSGPRSSGSTVRTVTPRQSGQRGAYVSLATPPNAFVYFSSINSSGSVYIANSSIPTCFD